MDDNNSLIADNIISHNEADAHGAGVYLSNSTARLSGNQIVDNVAQGIGGGIVILDSLTRGDQQSGRPEPVRQPG